MKASIGIPHRRRWASPAGLSPGSPIRRGTPAKPIVRAAVVVSLLFLAAAFALTLHSSVVLMHLQGPSTLDALPQVIEGIRSAGYELGL